MNATRTPREVGELWFGPMWSGRDGTLMRELMAPGALAHLEGGVETVGPEGFEKFQQEFVQAVPDVQLKIVNLLADGDDVCVHWKASGTHTGSGMGMDPTGAKLEFQGVAWLRVENGQIVEGWDFWNQGGVMQVLTGAATVAA